MNKNSSHTPTERCFIAETDNSFREYDLRKNKELTKCR